MSILSVKADTIQFTIVGTVSGTLNGTAFSNQAFSLSLTADPSKSFAPGGGAYVEGASSNRLRISVVGLGSITDKLTTFVNRGTKLVGADDSTASTSNDWFNLYSSSLGTYDLRLNIGPLTTPLSRSSDEKINTSFGSLVLTKLNNGATYQAAVPETST